MIANPLGINGPRLGKTTGRLRNALTNLRTKQNIYPRKVAVHSLPLPMPKRAPQTVIRRGSAQEEAPDLGAALERFRTLTPPRVPMLPTSVAAAKNMSLLSMPLPAPVQVTPAQPVVPTSRGVGRDNPTVNMAIGQRLAESMYGWTGAEWQALKELWMRESGWRASAVNSSSGAAGIPQALPSAHPDVVTPEWMRDPVAQIRWGLRYIAERYGSPTAALAHSNQHHWY